jgi:N-acetylneuraminic acid mutarotase
MKQSFLFLNKSTYPMKATLSFLSFLLYTASSFSQTGSSTFQTWMKGDNTIDQAAMYGIQGTGAATNKPGARNFSATWTDNNDNLWLFGGYGYDGSGLGYLNDLWKYSPATNQWTWVKGDNTIAQSGVYGVQGIANAANKPGAIYSSVSWTDASGNLWLFGGFGYTDSDFGFLNDLWKYDPATNQWTWIKGDNTVDQAGVYGMQGVADAINRPGARYGSRTWTDGGGNLWLFGGYGLDSSSTTGSLNDLWKYNPLTNEWTWIKGDNKVDQPGIYGERGVAGVDNMPGARYVSVSWTDATGNLWLFGGSGFNGNTQGDLNDLWKYNPVTNEWTWIKGDSSINQPGIYGERGVAGVDNMPGARYVSVSWTDATGNLWLFGGYGYDTGSEGYLNDLWAYNPSADKWTWIKGDNKVDQLGVYGIQGMPSATNKSGARTSCISWTDRSGDLWLFGGYGFDTSTSGILNDLWKISSMTVLPLQLLHFSGVLDNNIVRLQWQTTPGLNFSHFIIQRSFDGTRFTSIGTISGAGNIVRSSYSYYDNDLQNRQEQKIFYRLQLMDIDSHFTYSRIIRFDMNRTAALHVFPNPAVNSLNLSFDQNNPGPAVIRITDMKGVTIKKQEEDIVAGRTSMSIDVSTLPSGTYILSVVSESGTTQQKFIKQ